MKIVVLAGGTGPIALQRGLFQVFESRLDEIETKIIVNAYDNGLSTGAVRQVMDGRILGPSDVRKNHTTRLKLIDPQSPWVGFLDYRFSADTADARTHCENRLKQLRQDLLSQGRLAQGCDIVFEAIGTFFTAYKAQRIAYEDFSLANIFYAGLAAQNDCSLRRAAGIIAGVLGIPDHVILNDDKSLFLGAVTRSGRRIADEGEIVAWANENDPITDTFFVDADGHEDTPQLCLESWEAIIHADLILLSSGTQWSSLIPTYASRGFKAAIRESEARVVMIMNRAADKDALGQSASDIINMLVPRYFDENRLHVLVDTNGQPGLTSLTEPALRKAASLTRSELSGPSDPPEKHNPTKLARAIGQVLFKDYLDSDAFLFDYDDTLVGRKGEYPISSRFNVDGIRQLNRLTHVGICTGNTVSALTLREERPNADGSAPKPLLVFADGGINQYSYHTSFDPGAQASKMLADACLAPDVLLNANDHACVTRIVDRLQRVGIAGSKIENRGDVVIAVKPIGTQQRRAVVSMIRSIVQDFGLEVRESGRTTVEIRHPRLSKAVTLKHLQDRHWRLSTITYVGDECDGGNDHDVATLANEHTWLRCLRVKSPAHTALFIATLLGRLADDGQH